MARVLLSYIICVMRILEVLNSYPGETFIKEHARAVVNDGRVNLGWCFWQVKRQGALPPPLEGLYACGGLFNPNRASRLTKAVVRLKHLNRKDSYQRELLRHIASFTPDLMHFHFATTAVQHYQIALALKIPFTFSVRGSDILVTPKTDQRFTKKLIDVVQSAAGIHSVSEHLRAKLFEYGGKNEKTVVIRTAIDHRWSHISRSISPLTFVAVGRLHWVKGYGDLLLSIKILFDAGMDVQLKIVGEGDQRQMLEYMIRDLGLSDRVELTGQLSADQIGALLARSEALILSSLSEGFPNVAAEAMMAGVPVIATTASMVHEVFEPGKCFIMSETGNPSSLAEAISTCIKLGESEKARMVDLARGLALKHFLPQSHAEQFFSFWKNALGSTSG